MRNPQAAVRPRTDKRRMVMPLGEGKEARRLAAMTPEHSKPL
jgi:hypothetical protein